MSSANIETDGSFCIPLTQGLVAMVDQEDYGFLSEHHWLVISAGCHHKLRYAAMTTKMGGHRRFHLMHNLIMKLPEHCVVDHRDRDGLNNRRYNLRMATRSQNNSNAVKRGGRTSSRFKGVWYAGHHKN